MNQIKQLKEEIHELKRVVEELKERAEGEDFLKYGVGKIYECRVSYWESLKIGNLDLYYKNEDVYIFHTKNESYTVQVKRIQTVDNQNNFVEIKSITKWEKEKDD